MQQKMCNGFINIKQYINNGFLKLYVFKIEKYW